MLVKRGFRKCWKVFIIDFVFIIDVDSNNNTSITFDQGFVSFLTTANLQNKTTPSGCLKKKQQKTTTTTTKKKTKTKWSYLAANDLIESPNYRIYTAHG